MLSNLSKYYRYVDQIGSTINWCIRTFSVEIQAQVKVESSTEVEWVKAKPFLSLPGPSKLGLLRSFMPGGKLHKLHFLEVNKAIFKEYGPIIRFPGTFGKPDLIFTFDPKAIEIIFRNEGQWPTRRVIDTFDYYRREIRPDIFKGVGGLLNDQGEAWGKLRNTLNPIMMKPKVVKPYIPDIDKVAKDFVRKIKTLRDAKNEMPNDFLNELNKWALEAIALVALEHRLGLLTTVNDPDNQRVINAAKDSNVLAYELDVLPSIWKYYKTPKFNRLMASFDVITNLSKKHIDRAIEQLEKQPAKSDGHEDSVLRKILQINKHYAFVMALDMLMAGIDTTSSATAALLYNLATNQRVQDTLRKEVMTVLPNKDSSLTPESLNNLPYLRACIRESIRIFPITIGLARSTDRNIVLQGYQIPKDTVIILGTVTLGNDNNFVERADEFIPERYLKDVPAGCPNSKDIHPFMRLPFGFGARSCIGKRFAEMEIEVLIIRLLREFKIEWNYGPLEFIDAIIVAPSTDLKYKMTNL